MSLTVESKSSFVFVGLAMFWVTDNLYQQGTEKKSQGFVRKKNITKESLFFEDLAEPDNKQNNWLEKLIYCETDLIYRYWVVCCVSRWESFSIQTLSSSSCT